jgi:hypothetical protein
MPTETTGRPLLPQTAQMQSFTFAPPTLAPRENQRSEFCPRSTFRLSSWQLTMPQTMFSWTSTTGTSASKVRILCRR